LLFTPRPYLNIFKISIAYIPPPSSAPHTYIVSIVIIPMSLRY
jgi:hypothetical protein